jgi:hypothetical protein
VQEKNFQRTLVDANLAKGAFFGVDSVCPVFFIDRFARADLLAAPALVAHMNFKRPGLRKFTLEMNGRLLGVVLLEVGQGADYLAEGTTCATVMM